ncbi:MAG: hypothetical protein KC910_08810 [Candidatus Eremiobacteraeota bacterium]|nr:hypothetical protein [Candidatus Eremiobacteraeota bacterium]
MKRLLLLGLIAIVLLAACSSEHRTFVGFTLGGKSYSTASAKLTLESDQVILTGQGPELEVRLVAAKGEGEVVGRTLPIRQGELKIGQATHKVQSGQLTVQTLAQIARGNFDLVLDPNLKVVGSFDAAR